MSKKSATRDGAGALADLIYIILIVVFAGMVPIIIGRRLPVRGLFRVVTVFVMMLVVFFGSLYVYYTVYLSD